MFKYSTNMQQSLTKCPAASAAAKLLQSCLNLFDPIDGSPPGSATPGILQARTQIRFRKRKTKSHPVSPVTNGSVHNIAKVFL